VLGLASFPGSPPCTTMTKLTFVVQGREPENEAMLGQSVCSMYSVCLFQLVNSSHLAITVVSLGPIRYSVTQARPSMSCVYTINNNDDKTGKKRSEETIVRVRLGPGRASETGTEACLGPNDTLTIVSSLRFVSFVIGGEFSLMQIAGLSST